jgi:hypothetical protein
MDPKSGAIAHFERESDAKKAGFTVPLSKDQADMAQFMNRKQRRAWASTSRKKNKRR